jgi:hydroxymethylpyrimidine pyrophosphatase-like HAD family hydrolase
MNLVPSATETRSTSAGTNGSGSRPLDKAETPAAGLLAPELTFYQAYPWSLNPLPTVGSAAAQLAGELDRLLAVPDGWPRAEVMTNVYLLSCILLNSVDDYLLGPLYRLPRRVAALPLLGRVLGVVRKGLGLLRRRRVNCARRWRSAWQATVHDFLALFVAEQAPTPDALARVRDGLTAVLRTPLPADLRAEYIHIPSAFRKQDLTHFDILALGRRLVERYPDRTRPVLLLGLRTGGSHFAPLLGAFLEARGYTAAVVTVRPDRGPTAAERAEIVRCAAGGHLAVILDDPPASGDTIALAVDMLRKAGFGPGRTAALFPIHPLRRDWRSHVEAVCLGDLEVLTLEPEDWHKQHLLDPAAAEARLTEYFQGLGYKQVRIVPGPAADRLNADLQELSEESRRTRLKRIYEVRLQSAAGETETRHVLAKSVGWGYLGYHAFLTGRRLTGFVPPLLGLRDGILYTEWLPQPPAAAREDRDALVETAARYVAARVRTLALEHNPLPGLGLNRQHDGFELLEKVLSKAYPGPAANLARGRIRQRLATQPCPHPTLIDAKMRRLEWIAGPSSLLKTDFEHHGLGKNELNVIDPAYDLADAVLHLGLSFEEEERLLAEYVAKSGDVGVGQRLFLHKLLAGTWAMAGALKNLFQQPHLVHRQPEFDRQFVRAWDFLTVQSARFCGSLCRARRPAGSLPAWDSSLIVLDVDGVLDRRLFGFPSTTAAGIQALSLLHAHERAVVINTARSVTEVREYCRAYGLAGGVAEYGSYAWDAVAGRGRPLVSDEALAQLGKARTALERLPGVFVNPGYEYSLRAYTYSRQGPVPVPALTVQRLLAAEGLDRLCVHQTTIDSAILAKEVDKGTGLVALLDWVGLPHAETVAVGDSEPDLPMFRAATRSFAPAQIDCGRLARLLGCRIARQPYQRGLLEIVRGLLHPDRRRCGRCAAGEQRLEGRGDLFLDLLAAADLTRPAALLRTVFDRKAFRVFRE